ncbi:MAG: DUF4411 family protein [Bacteroidales bacterium]|nr:DUF4411 family protein [Bacteroidales bacterium]
MKAVIDTSSLVSLVRYYLPFDTNETLKTFLKERVEAKDLIVLEQVAAECKLQGKGQVVKALPFVDKPKNITAVNDVPIDKRLFHMIDNNFINGSVAKLLPEAEYQFEREGFMKTADFAMVLYAYSIKKKEDVVIVTEETSYSNDGKPFKKIPGICDTIGVRTQNLPTFLFENSIIDLTVEVQKTSLF